MEIKTVNGQRFEVASAISQGSTYRFDLSPQSETATAVKYSIRVWTFQTESGIDVTYSTDELRGRLEAGSIWKKLG